MVDRKEIVSVFARMRAMILELWEENRELRRDNEATIVVVGVPSTAPDPTSIPGTGDAQGPSSGS